MRLSFLLNQPRYSVIWNLVQDVSLICFLAYTEIKLIIFFAFRLICLTFASELGSWLRTSESVLANPAIE